MGVIMRKLLHYMGFHDGWLGVRIVDVRKFWHDDKYAKCRDYKYCFKYKCHWIKVIW